MSNESSTVDRREALKKAAIAAGVGVWAAPVIQTVIPGIASAAVTNCHPVGSLVLVSTGPSGSGCNNHTFYIQASGTFGCGSSCPGAATVVVTSVTGGTFADDCQATRGSAFRVIDLGTCSSGTSAPVTINFTVTCADGVVHSCSQTTTYACATGIPNGPVTGGCS